jgi:hypothetical protein
MKREDHEQRICKDEEEEVVRLISKIICRHSLGGSEAKERP